MTHKERIRLLVLLAGIILSCHRLQAQQVLVCDAVSRFPIRDVAVTADGRPAGLTTWQGIVSLPDSFQLASFKKKGYAPEKLRRDEILRDTVFLFPAEHYLDEVVVVGKQTVDGAELLKKMPKRDILEEASPHAAGGFDLGLLLDKRLRRDKKHVRKLREIFKRMDGVADDEDPILKAYRETLMEMKNTSPAHSSPTSPTIPPQQDGK